METPEMTITSSPIGVLILGRKRPGFDQEWNRMVCRRSVEALENLGYTCIGNDTPVVDDQSLELALQHIREKGCEVLLMLQPSMGNGQLSLSLAQLWPGPILLWATPERPADGKVSSCSLVGQHLWASILRQARHPFEFVYGDPDDASVRQELLRGIHLSRTAMLMRNAKVGIIGGHAPGFIDISADPFLLRQSLGVQLHSFSLPQFIDRVNKIGEARVTADVSQVRGLKLPLLDVEEGDLAVNSRCYLAMRDLMKEEALDGLSIQCWPEVPDILGQWPYLAISRLTSEGRAVSMEGDVDGALAELMGLSLGLGPGFLTDWLEHDHSTIFLWHPGMAPLNMCHSAGAEKCPVLARHFNIVKPLVVDGQLLPDKPATIVRLWHCDNEYVMTAFEGKTICPPRTVTGNSITVELPGTNVPELFDRLIHGGMPHHVLLYYGRHGDIFRRLARLLRIRWLA